MAHRYLTAGVCLAALVVAQPLWAQQAPGSATADASAQSGGLEEIIVTAQKRSESLQKVPIAIAAVTPQQLTNSGIQSTQGLAAALPGLQLLNIGGNVTPYVRGVGSGFAAAGLESPVATYVDGVYYANPADVNMDLFDIEQVSVIKGPQGTLFGRNATGGVLQITTREPSVTFGGRARIGFDEYETLRADGFVAGPLSETVRASLAGTFSHQGQGWGRNVFTGHDTYKADHIAGVRGKVEADLSDTTVIRLSADYSDRHGPMAMNFRALPGTGIAFPTPQPTRPWDTKSYVDAQNDYSGGGVSVTLDQDLGDLKLTMISAYRKSRNFFRLSPSVTTTPVLDINSTDHSEQVTQEIQLASSDSGRLTWQTGFYYFYNKANRKQALFFRPGFAANLGLQVAGDPAVGPMIFPFDGENVDGTQRVDSAAAYAQATYRITDSTRFTAGFRYTWQWTKFHGTDVFTLPGGGAVTVADIAGEKSSFRKPTWRLALDHDFAPNVTGFVSYNRGVKSGGYNISTPINPVYLPEQLDSYEGGLKSELFQRRVRLNVSGFYYNYKNIQVPAFSTVLIIVNGASAELYGLDAELTAKVGDNLTLNAGANLLHARFKSFPGATFTTPLPNGQPNSGFPGDASGNTIPYSPKLTYTFGATYTIPSSVGEFALNATDSYNSGFMAEADNRLRQDSYHFLNASIAWTSPSKALTARLYINNILNKAVVSQFSTVAGISYIGDYTNPPRIFGGSLEWNF